MLKVEYIIGAFLTEMDIITHNIPETTVKHKIENEKIVNHANKKTDIKRKTTQTTKNSNKPDIS